MTGGGAGGPARALDRRARPEVTAVWPTSDRFAGRARLGGDRYSRRVALLKRLLPAVGLTLLVLVAVWPRLGPLLDSVRLGFPAIDLREARELRMLNPRYAGTDRFNRPYVVTSAIGRQVPNRDDLMSLEQPKAEMTMHRGAGLVKLGYDLFSIQKVLPLKAGQLGWLLVLLGVAGVFVLNHGLHRRRGLPALLFTLPASLPTAGSSRSVDVP